MQGAWTMDKAKVITAYMKGFVTLKECEQILGMDAAVIQELTYARVREEREARNLKPVPNP